jgi:16S rRNA processing protein RimM
MKDSPNRITIGKIAGAFGIRGQVKVTPLTAFNERFDKGQTVFLDGQPLKIKASQWHKSHFLLTLEGIEDATSAENLQWKTLEAEAGDGPELDEDEYLTKDLIGLLVFTEEGRPLGKVDRVLPYPAHDILVVGPLMIPAVKEFVKAVDLENKTIAVHLLEGMEE